MFRNSFNFAILSSVKEKFRNGQNRNLIAMEKQKVSYSSILIDFINPLLTGKEDEYEFLAKAKLGQMAWNFSVSDLNKLPFDNIHKEIFLITLKQYDKELKETLNMLVMRKGIKFSQYNQFIFNIEMRTNKYGQKTLYAESAPADKIKMNK